jgi:hypothetical protein
LGKKTLGYLKKLVGQVCSFFGTFLVFCASVRRKDTRLFMEIFEMVRQVRNALAPLILLLKIMKKGLFFKKKNFSK